MRPSLRVLAAFVLPFAVLMLWPAAYAFVCDDAYISFRFVRNLLRGDGLVWNPGEYVEGYTNFLWVLELAAIWGALGVRPEVASVVLSWALTAATGLLVVRMALHTPYARWRWAVAWAALALYAGNRSVAVWATSGLETRQFTFLATAALYAFTRWRDGSRWLVAGSTLFGLAALTRPEALLMGPAVMAWWGLDALARRRLAPADVLRAGGPFALLVGGHLAFRLAYYGEWLPNTYYAKVVRPWWDAGAMYWGMITVEHALWLVVPLAVAGTVARLRAGDAAHLAGWAWMIPETIHWMKIGGDHFEFRPLDAYWPLLYVAAADGLALLATAAARRAPSWPRLPAAVGAGGLAVALVYGLAIPLAHDRLARERTGRGQTYDMHVEVSRENSPWVYALPGNALLMPAYNRWSDWLTDHAIAIRHQEHREFAKLMGAMFLPYLAWEDDEDVWPADAYAAVSSIGIIGYALPSLRLLDKKGLCDWEIARQPVTTPNDERRMAHDHFPTKPYLRQRGVNLDIDPFRKTLGQALRRSAYALELGPGAYATFNPFHADDEAWIREAFGQGPYPLHARPEPPTAERADEGG